MVNEDKPFLSEFREQFKYYTFKVTPQYNEALIPGKMELEKERAVFMKLANQSPESIEMTDSRLKEINSEILALEQQISEVSQEILDSLIEMENQEAQISSLEHKRQSLLNTISSLKPLLDSAQMLQSFNEEVTFSDIQISEAITPDKRIFPRRAYMTLGGAALAVILFCGLAFFQDIWAEVIKPEDAE